MTLLTINLFLSIVTGLVSFLTDRITVAAAERGILDAALTAKIAKRKEKENYIEKTKIF